MYKGPNRKFKVRAPKKRRKSVSEYGQQLAEKQKLRSIYGIREKTLKNYYLKAFQKRSNIDVALVALVEGRLDNVVYRLGWSKTRSHGAQLVGHGHILVNGKTVKVPSYQITEHDVIEIKPAKKDLYPFRDLATKLEKHTVISWLKIASKDKMKAEVVSLPSSGEFSEPVNLSAVLQFYSR